MKEGIHPKYVATKILCACGNLIDTRSTRGDFHVEICANCHPFFTGKQKIMDTAGRIEKFKNRYGESPVTDPSATKKAEAKAEAPAAVSKKAAAAAENRAAKRAKANAGKPKPEPKAEVAPEAPAAEAKPE